MNTSAPVAAPPVPAARHQKPGGLSVNAVFWVRHGEARLVVDDGDEFCLHTGEAVWIPVGTCVSTDTVTTPGSVVIPLGVRRSEVPDAPESVSIFRISPEWDDWLLQYFGLEVTPHTTRGDATRTLVDLVAESEKEVSPDTEVTLPESGPARTVARAIFEDPSLPYTVSEWAEQVNVSSRTLRRAFLSGVGITFEVWRLRCRLCAASEFLAAGYRPVDVYTKVGFTTASGFTRAFRKYFGVTPSEVRESAGSELPSNRVIRARRSEELAVLASSVELRSPHDSAGDASAPLYPAHAEFHTNPMHILVWMYKGTGWLQTGNGQTTLRSGSVTLVPAGVEHRAFTAADSVLLPIADIGRDQIEVREPVQVQFTPAWSDYFLSSCVANRSRLRPEHYDPQHLLQYFQGQVDAQKYLDAPLPEEPRALALAEHFLSSLHPEGAPALEGIPADVRRAFLRDTGMSFRSWRLSVRMAAARDLLVQGKTPSSVGRRVGYSNLSSFSRAFHSFHGLSPRQWLVREGYGGRIPG